MPFLLGYVWLMLAVKPLLSDIYLIFSLDLAILVNLIWISVALLITSLGFVLFTSLANDWKLVLPAVVVASIIPALLFALPLSLFISIGSLLTLTILFFSVKKKFANYLTFEPNHLVTPSIKSQATLLILVMSVYFYLQANLEISTKGFQVPDSLINSVLQIASPATPAVQGTSIAELPSLTPEQLQYLKQHPDLVRQSGINPSVLNSVSTTPTTSKATSTKTNNTANNPVNNQLKPLIQAQIQQFIKPFEKFIPAILAILFFFTLQSFVSIGSLLLSPLILLIFWILEKTNFIHFEKEMREVKKLVV